MNSSKHFWQDVKPTCDLDSAVLPLVHLPDHTAEDGFNRSTRKLDGVVRFFSGCTFPHATMVKLTVSVLLTHRKGNRASFAIRITLHVCYNYLRVDKCYK